MEIPHLAFFTSQHSRTILQYFTAQTHQINLHKTPNKFTQTHQINLHKTIDMYVEMWYYKYIENRDIFLGGK